MAESYLDVPLKDEDILGLKIGDIVYFSGEAWTGRSRLHKRVFEEGYTLPFSTEKRNLLVHAGPVVIRDGGKWKLTSFNLTSSIQFEKWGPLAVEKWGLKAVVGKATMGTPTRIAMKESVCIHATPVGVTPGLYLDKIKVRDVCWLDELGSIEAAWILKIKEFGPFLVDIDCEGRSYFEQVDTAIDASRQKAYQKLGIPENFEYTRLY